MLIIFFVAIYLVGVVIVAVVGAERKVGFFMAFIAAVGLTPPVAFFLVTLSKSKAQEQWERELVAALTAQKKQLDDLCAKVMAALSPTE